MRHRRLVTTAAVVCLVALAGCTGPAGSLSMEPVDDAALADRASTGLPEEELSERDERDRSLRVLRRLARNESATVAATEPPLDANATVYRTGNRFFALSYDIVDTTTGRRVTYRLDGNATTEEADRNGWTVADYDDLPPVDRAKLDTPVSYLAAEASSRSIAEETRTYSPAELNRSTAARGGYDAVRYDGTLIELDVVSNESQPLTVYRYRPRSVASAPGPYAACLRDEYAFELRGLDPAAREALAEATDGTYRAENTSDAAFRSLLDRFHGHAAVAATAGSGSWLVRYEGRLYWVDLRYHEFEAYREPGPPVRDPVSVCS